MKNTTRVVWFFIIIFSFMLVGCPDPSSTKTETKVNTGGNTNNPPMITSLTANPAFVSFGGTSTLTCLASDVDGDSLTYVWSADSGVITGNGSSAVWVAPAIAGTTIVTCKVSDSKLETSSQVNILVSTGGNTNNPPVITSLIASPATVMFGGTSTLTCLASDVDGDSLTYVWSADSGVITGNGSSAVWVAPVTAGTSIITCKVSDSRLETSSQVSVAIQDWVVPTQFASSLTNCDFITDGTVYNGKLYLTWWKSDSLCIGPDKSYLSIFSSNSTDAIELSRTEILINGGYAVASSVAIDNEIYLSANYMNQGYLMALDLNTQAPRWTVSVAPQNQNGAKIVEARDGYIYVAGEVYGALPGFIDNGTGDIIIGKYDINGNSYWLSQWGTTCIDYAGSIEIKADGVYVGVGAGNFCNILQPSTPPPSYTGNLTLKYDFNGNLLSVTQP